MTVLNTTFHVDRRVGVEFLAWLRDEYMVAASAADAVSTTRLMRLLAEVAEGADSYALHLEGPDTAALERWHDTEGRRLLDRLFRKVGQRVVHFTTYMEVV
ncbi:MAG: DUF4286 family protein [Pseudoflavonifractor sp.]|nr:DUF4286 family protein [Pseudoflavonifractor sp.]